MAIIEITDLPTAVQSAELVEAMIAGANARALRVAPCLGYVDDAEAGTTAPTSDQLAEARLVLIGAIRRWVEAGTGSFQQQAAGPFSVSTDTRQRTGYNLWPSEIEGLQEICATGATGRQAFSLDTAPVSSAHMPWCSLAFGALYCSCGADLTNYEYPLYEGGVLSE